MRNRRPAGRLMPTWSGTAVALTSISHGGQTLGTIKHLRRERILAADGTLTDIPIISGNSFRGRLRAVGYQLWLADAGYPALTWPVLYALACGGALAKHRGPPLVGERLQRLRALCPQVGVFGAAGGGRMLDGIAQVSKLIPICRQTAHLQPDGDGDNLPDVDDLTQLETFTRGPNPGERPGAKPTRMRYDTETLIPGTRFTLRISSNSTDERLLSFLSDVIGAYSADALIGGRVGTGHGRIRLQLSAPHPAPQPGLWRRGGAPLDGAELKLMAALD